MNSEINNKNIDLALPGIPVKMSMWGSYKKRWIFAVCVVLSVAVAYGIYAWYGGHYPFSKDQIANEAENTKALISQVSKIIVLPEGEQPTVATVSDPNLLRSQPFFARARRGYKVLIYAKSKKAILYDPISNKIVEVAPINLDQNKDIQK